LKKFIATLIGCILLSASLTYAGNGDLTVDGTINAGTGGIKFSDGTVQSTAKKLVIRRYGASSNTGQIISAKVTYNNTMPSITDGTQIFAGTVTPSSASSVFTVHGIVNAVKNINNTGVCIILFRDSTLIGAAISNLTFSGQSSGWNTPYSTRDAPGDTNPHTYSVRVGVCSCDSGSVYLNYSGPTLGFGAGTMVSTMIVDEELP